MLFYDKFFRRNKMNGEKADKGSVTTKPGLRLGLGSDDLTL